MYNVPNMLSQLFMTDGKAYDHGNVMENAMENVHNPNFSRTQEIQVHHNVKAVCFLNLHKCRFLQLL